MKMKAKNTRSYNRINMADLLPSGSHNTAILKERAAHLSKVKTSTVTGDDNLDSHYLAVTGEEVGTYGILYSQLTEIRSDLYVTRVPNVNKKIMGVTSWHSKLIPVINLLGYLCDSYKSENQMYRNIVVAMIEGIPMAFCVDEILGIRVLKTSHKMDEIHDNNLININNDFVKFVEDGNIIIIDLNKIAESIAKEKIG